LGSGRVRSASCASAGVDYRHCCARADVPAACLHLCSGGLLLDDPPAAQQSACVDHRAAIVSCVQDSHGERRFGAAASATSSSSAAHLAGPPARLRVAALSARATNVSWDAPALHAASVEAYVLYYKRRHDDHYQTVTHKQLA